MRESYIVYLVSFMIAAAAAVAVFLYWVATRKRLAAETVGRAQEDAQRIVPLLMHLDQADALVTEAVQFGFLKFPLGLENLLGQGEALTIPLSLQG